MWPVLYELLKALGSALGTGVAVKLMDDHLDMETDALMAKFNYAAWLGQSCLPYALSSLALGVAFDVHLALGVFLGCYAVGMIPDSSMLLPTGLRAWQESLVVLGISLAIIGYRSCVFGVLVSLCVEIADDLLDEPRKVRKLVLGPLRRSNKTELILALFVLVLAALVIDPLRTICAGAAAGAIWLHEHKMERLNQKNSL